MILPTHIRVAIASLKSTRVRTSLTTLGIVIGVMSITLVLALGEGAKQALSKQVDDLGSDVVLVKPGRQDQRNAFDAYNPFSISPTTTLTERDLQSIQDLETNQSASPLMFVNGSVRSTKDSAEAVPIIGTDTELASTLKLKVQSGQFLDPTTSRDTVVLGQSLAIELLGTDQARGQEVIVKGRPHTVIGVMRNTNRPINIVGVDLDRSAFISLDDSKSFNQGIAQIQQIIVKTKPDVATSAVAATIDKTLIDNHAGERDFSVLEGPRAAESANAFYTIIVAITTTVAGVALIVGGIGIMNVMLVSVTERTREIGIRKALGATDTQIMMQFLIESLVMTTAGGIIGIGLAYAAAFVIASLFAFQPALSWAIVGAGFGLSFIVGITFGLFPALRASRKEPISALRQYQ